MQTICPKKWLPKFRSFLREKESLIIRKPTLGDNRGKLKYVDNSNKICFQPYTAALLCKDFAGSYYGFNFASFQSVEEKRLPENVTIDAIGYIKKCYEIEDTSTRTGNVGKRMNLRIVDLEGRQLNVTLWDQYASQLNSYLTNNKNETHVVIILQFGVIKFYKDKAYHNNAYTVSRLFINSDIEEIKAFKKRYLGDVELQNTSSAQHGVGSSILSTLHDEFLIDNDFNFVADIADIKQIN
ncbi:replication protein A 70 kDa DNA-binding subunit A-like [Bidens hawaiensis]|uniref:replication protein A 70 kDa DNA-binding subunit A-like n=1 Tax=Bidens hawaiensis TaxID=980011 RepID=UPI00404B2EEA